VVPISSKKDEIVSVWNGTRFTDVMIAQTGHEKQFLKIHFSNGLCLTCTPYHKFFIVSKQDQQIIKIHASDITCGDEIAPFQLPSISTIDVLPSSIVMTLEWIAKRCVYMENNVVLFDRDVESLKDILLDLQYCGLKSEIVCHPHRNEYELRINKTRWNMLNYRHLNKNTSYIEGDIVQHLQVVRTETTQKYQESYCFHEPFTGTSIFEGVATGQCENLSDVVCVQGHVDVSRFLKTNPLKKQLQNHQVIVYTTQECPFMRLLRHEYNNIEIREIETWEEEWNTKRHVHALSTVPAIFLDNLYVGNFMDFWKHYLCPVFDTDNLRHGVYALCHGLDNAVDQEKNVVNEFCFRRNRPLVLFVRGFREVLLQTKLSMEETETHQLNKAIFETIHYAALKASVDMAAQKGPCVNSDKICSFFEPLVKPHEHLRHNIMNHGLRNMIYIRTYCDDDEEEAAQQSFGHFKQMIGTQDDIPNSLKKIYQEPCQQQKLQLMVDRKKYNVVDETFDLYLDDEKTEHEISGLQQQLWKEGFYTIRVHHRTKKQTIQIN
jgi:ribonucleotide reductase alpha subunit